MGPVFFELDRFELTDEQRISVSGRWFGVRGRRFVRPTLTMRTAEGHRRSLADLAHKPWAAEDGQPWEAEFAVQAADADMLEAELAVAPDIEVVLPAPGGERDRRTRLAAPAHRGGGERPRRARQRPHGTSTRGEPDAARNELAGARREIERLTAELAAAEGAKVEAAAALARRDAVLSDLERLTAERDEAAAARRQAEAELEEARGAHASAEQLRDAAIAARDSALHAQHETDAQREHAVEELTRQVAARDARLEELLRVVADRDARLAELTPVLAERDALQASLANLQAEQAALSSSRGAALVMHNSTRAGGVRRRDWDWISRGLSVVLLAIVALAVALIAHLI